MQTHKGRGRGFASMSPEQKREIAAKGGKAAHAQCRAHKWTPEEASRAGKRGGALSRCNRALSDEERARILAELAQREEQSA